MNLDRAVATLLKYALPGMSGDVRYPERNLLYRQAWCGLRSGGSMNIRSGFVALSVLAAMLVIAGPGRAQTAGATPGSASMVVAAAPAVAEKPVPAVRPMTDGEKQAAGCIISGTATMAATYALGPSEMIMLIVGGLIVPSNSASLFISLLGTMGSMGCGAGAAITPAVLWAFKSSDPGPARDQ